MEQEKAASFSSLFLSFFLFPSQIWETRKKSMMTAIIL